MVSTAVPASSRASQTAVKAVFKNIGGVPVSFLPQQIGVIGQGSDLAAGYPLLKEQVFSADEVAAKYGRGSNLHLAVKSLLPPIGGGVGSIPVVLLPLAKDGAGVAAAGGIVPVIGTITETDTFWVVAGGEKSSPFVVGPDDTVATIISKMETAMAGATDMPVLGVDTASTSLDITAKCAGTHGNSISLDVEGPTTIGVTFTITPMASGAANPDVADGLALVGDQWLTYIVNTHTLVDTDALDAYRDFANARDLPEVGRTVYFVTGTSEASVNTAKTVPEVRRTEKWSILIDTPNSGAGSMPLIIAADAIADVTVLANRNPGIGYQGSEFQGVVAGADSDQWSLAELEAALQGGVATTKKAGGLAIMHDWVSFYHPEGITDPSHRYPVVQERVRTMRYNLEQVFSSPEWQQKILVPDEQAVSTPDARKPKSAVAVVYQLIDFWAINGLISDPDFAKANVIAEIDSQNANRLNVSVTVLLSGNTNIKSIDLNYGVYVGSQAA